MSKENGPEQKFQWTFPRQWGKKVVAEGEGGFVSLHIYVESIQSL